MTTATHTFAILDVSQETMDDISVRLIKASGGTSDYIQEHDGEVLIVFGTVALRAENTDDPVERAACRELVARVALRRAVEKP